MAVFKFLSKENREDLDKGLEKTKGNIFSNLSRAVAGKNEVDDQTLDDIEEALVAADVSVDTTIKIIDRLEKAVSETKYRGEKELFMILKQVIIDILDENNVEEPDGFTVPDNKPHIIMVVGVNGAGKTTTIGKLAYHFKKSGYKLLLGAGDTFRAAAVDQLDVWAERVSVPIIKKEMGSDPAAVAYETAQAAKDYGSEVVLLDTAGRLHNKVNLMNELAKIKRVMSKVYDDAPHEVLLVLDGSSGQNAIEQAKKFMEFTQVNSIAITKLDGTAKGGVVLAIADQFKIPIKYIGVGEKADQLQVFNKHAFIESLFS